MKLFWCYGIFKNLEFENGCKKIVRIRAKKYAAYAEEGFPKKSIFKAC